MSVATVRNIRYANRYFRPQMSVWADFVLYAIQKGFGNAPKLSCPSSSWSSWPASSAPSSWLEFEYLSGEPARCHLKGSAARKVEQQGGQEKERRRRCRQEKVSTHCGWGQRAQLAWQPEPPSRLPSSQPSLLLNCSADHPCPTSCVQQISKQVWSNSILCGADVILYTRLPECCC